MTPPRPHRRHDRRAGGVVLAACLCVLPGCVFHGPHRTGRAFVEQHPLEGRQTVVTVSGQLPPKPREVHDYRLRHGAPRVQVPVREAFPWWPGVRDGLIEAGDAALAALGRAARDADLPRVDLDALSDAAPAGPSDLPRFPDPGGGPGCPPGAGPARPPHAGPLFRTRPVPDCAPGDQRRSGRGAPPHGPLSPRTRP